MQKPELPQLGGLRGLVHHGEQWRAGGHAFALALVVARSGATYRKPGAVVLVTDDGRYAGALSGGCLEPQLIAAAQAAIKLGSPQLLVFDTTDDGDLLFGSGSACRGRLDVLLLPDQHAHGGALFDALRQAAAGRANVYLQVRLDELQAPLADIRLGEFPTTVLPERVEGLLQVCVPRARNLLILGGSPEAAQLMTLARQQGWCSTVSDIRAGHRDRLAAADQVLELRPDATGPLLAAPTLDALLIMHHRADLDLLALKVAAAGPGLRYVGLLGPPTRRAELLGLLSAEQREQLAGRLHAPIGLALGGEGAEAIALAIAAELLQHFASEQGRR